MHEVTEAMNKAIALKYMVQQVDQTSEAYRDNGPSKITKHAELRNKSRKLQPKTYNANNPLEQHRLIRGSWEELIKVRVQERGEMYRQIPRNPKAG